MRDKVRTALVSAGTQLGTGALRQIREVVSHVELGHWLGAEGYPMPRGPRPVGRWPVLDAAIAEVSGQQLLYLEFGVYRGTSITYVTRHVRDADARFVGFDSFFGLPEEWRADMPRGHFTRNGLAPSFDDPRVSVVTGLFEKTLADFEVPPHERLIVNIDSDLYSSARTVLARLAGVVGPGTLIYLDEFNDSANELRAFREFLQLIGRRVEVSAVSRCWSHWLFRCA